MDYQIYHLNGLDYDLNTTLGKICMEMLALRIGGYYKYYGNKLMPLDLYDHFSNHIVLSKKIGNEFKSIACVRYISLSRCIENDFVFLPLSRISSTSNAELEHHINHLILNNKNDSNDFIYNSGLTIHPSVTCSKEKRSIIKYIVGAALNCHKDAGNRKFIISAIAKVKTDRLFIKLGFKPICGNPYYVYKGLESEQFMILMFDGGNDLSEEWIEDTRKLWSARFEFERQKMVA